jgi:TetR/AcrR family transcriptional repressor of nem operon
MKAQKLNRLRPIQSCGGGKKRLRFVLAKQFEKLAPDAAKEQALVAFSTMVGALTLSRIVTDPELSITLLEQAEKHLVQTSRAME